MSLVARLAPRNRLLALLDPADRELLFPSLEFVPLGIREVLIEAGSRFPYVYFVEHGLLSVIAHPETQWPMEVGVIGQEGMLGTSLLYGDAEPPTQVFVQTEGVAYRVSADRFVAGLAESPSLRNFLLKYALAFHVQAIETSYANGRKTVAQRLARWILMAHDRAIGDGLHLTHEFLALMLAVRRPSVTAALQVLEGEHLIRNTRGHIVVRNRPGLEELAGVSYGLAEREYERLVGGPVAYQM